MAFSSDNARASLHQQPSNLDVRAQWFLSKSVHDIELRL